MALASVKRKKRQNRSVVLANRIFCESRETKTIGSRKLGLFFICCFCFFVVFIFLNMNIYLYIYLYKHTHKTALQQTRWQYPPTGKVSCWAHSLHDLYGQDSSSSERRGQVTHGLPAWSERRLTGRRRLRNFFYALCLPLVVVAEQIDVRSCNTVARPCKNKWESLKSNNNNNKRAGV